MVFVATLANHWKQGNADQGESLRPYNTCSCLPYSMSILSSVQMTSICNKNNWTTALQLYRDKSGIECPRIYYIQWCRRPNKTIYNTTRLIFWWSWSEQDDQVYEILSQNWCSHYWHWKEEYIWSERNASKLNAMPKQHLAKQFKSIGYSMGTQHSFLDHHKGTNPFQWCRKNWMKLLRKWGRDEEQSMATRFDLCDQAKWWLNYSFSYLGTMDCRKPS